MQLPHVGQCHDPHNHLFGDSHKRGIRRRFDNSWIMASYISRSEYVRLFFFGGGCGVGSLQERVNVTNSHPHLLYNWRILCFIPASLWSYSANKCS